MRIFDSKYLITRLFLSTIYIVVYMFIYKNYLVDIFGYSGYEYYLPPLDISFITVFLALFPVVFFTGVLSLSSFISIIIYLISYIPMLLTISVFHNISYEVCIGYQLILCLSMSAFFCVDKLKFSSEIKQLGKKIPFYLLVIFTILATLYILFYYRNNMKFVNFFESQPDLYEHRSDNYLLTSQSMINLYLLPWLINVLYPLLLIIFLKNKQYLKVILVLIGSFLFFMISAQKIDFFMPFILISFYLLIDKGREFVKKYLFSILVGLIVIVSIILFLVRETEFGFGLSAIFFVRTYSMAGFLFVNYVQFFLTNPFTDFAHINIINFITNGYPYGNEDLGRVVFHGDMNGNAMFWIMDGVAGQGIFGILLISLIFFGFLLFVNRLKSLVDERLLFVLFLPVIMYLINVSFFTTLLTGGCLLLLLILYFVKLPI